MVIIRRARKGRAVNNVALPYLQKHGTMNIKRHHSALYDACTASTTGFMTTNTREISCGLVSSHSVERMLHAGPIPGPDAFRSMLDPGRIAVLNSGPAEQHRGTIFSEVPAVIEKLSPEKSANKAIDNVSIDGSSWKYGRFRHIYTRKNILGI